MNGSVLAGYLVTFSVLGIYALSLLRRERLLGRELEDPLDPGSPDASTGETTRTADDNVQ